MRKTATWRSVNKKLRLGLVGNLENRRIREFRDAWLALGGCEPTLLSYRDLPEQAPQVDVLRLDSPGECALLAEQLIHLGGGPLRAHLQYGEVAYLREFHLGFCQILEKISGWGLPTFSAPSELAVMFDKWQSHLRFQAAGLARPQSLLAPFSFDEWRATLPPRGRIFLKPLHGSSASGVCAIRWEPGRQLLQSPLQIEGQRLFNCLRVQSYSKWSEIESILSRLLPQGMISETWIPKLSLCPPVLSGGVLGDMSGGVLGEAAFEPPLEHGSGGVVDLRVLVIAGKARHSVVRQSSSPMTNLHLGNRRGDLASLGELLKPSLQLAEQAAACFPGCHSVGVDILLDTRGRPWIGEINAFGDLLPGIRHAGEDAYRAIARSYCESQSCLV